jgi:hypothetical protein
MSDGIAGIPSIHHNSAADWLSLSEVIQNKTLILSVFVPLDGVRLCRDVFGSVVSGVCFTSLVAMALTSLRMARAFVGLSAESRNPTTTIASRQIDFTNYTCPSRKLQSTQQST